MMLRFRRSSFINGVHDLISINVFHQLSLYSTSTSISTEVNPNFVNYFIENLGFSKQQAVSTSSKFIRQRQGAKEISDNDFIKNSDSVIKFLKKIGLQQSHIQNAITVYPRMLMSNVDKTLAPKSDILQKLGFSGDHIAEIVSINPLILFRGFDTVVVPLIEILREIMGCEEDVILMLKKLRCSYLNVLPKYLVSNVALLRSYGIPLDSIRKNLPRNPTLFCRTTDELKKAVTRAEEKLGILRNSPKFLNGCRIVTSLTDKTIESKLQVYKSFGWTDFHFATLLSLNSSILSYSEDSIKKRLDYLMNEVGYDPSYLASRCNLFTCSLEKRIVPRHKVLLILKENGLMTDYSLPTVLSYSETKFLKKCVLPFNGVHEVYSKLTSNNLEVASLVLSKPNSTAL